MVEQDGVFILPGAVKINNISKEKGNRLDSRVLALQHLCGMIFCIKNTTDIQKIICMLS